MTYDMWYYILRQCRNILGKPNDSDSKDFVINFLLYIYFSNSTVVWIYVFTKNDFLHFPWSFRFGIFNWKFEKLSPRIVFKCGTLEQPKCICFASTKIIIRGSMPYLFPCLSLEVASFFSSICLNNDWVLYPNYLPGSLPSINMIFYVLQIIIETRYTYIQINMWDVSERCQSCQIRCWQIQKAAWWVKDLTVGKAQGKLNFALFHSNEFSQLQTWNMFLDLSQHCILKSNFSLFVVCIFISLLAVHDSPKRSGHLQIFIMSQQILITLILVMVAYD